MNALEVSFTEQDGTVKTLAALSGQTLMEVGRDNNVAGILADCGGSCSCATCHVYVGPEWFKITGGPDQVETEVLELLGDIAQPNSRLSCQIRLDPELDGITVAVAPPP